MHISETNFPIEEAWRGELEPPPGQPVFRSGGGGLLKVSIGRPTWWPGEAILGSDWHSPAGDRKYGLARFAITVAPDESQTVKSADLNIELTAPGSSERPVAFDLYPRELNQIRKDSLKLTISPALSFMEVEAALGGAELTLDLTNAVPVITAYGVGQTAVRWRFKSQAAHPLDGSRVVYAIIERPSAAHTVEAKIRLSAQTKTGFTAYMLGQVPQNAADSLTFTLGS